ncbi:bifunctional diaminohydroxyphosphoribosylaminopyrimidine deaminase/5-amino-6-(5-phosphoribosylamino)uracil reductase RibD [Gabonibacter massiliensis]|uniref:bifunctional diaminohydroxyphosphoribosylaminopyrimidine deaminase/5-amino-6-(5-phosphoribosylamino)uracil reductase RibD n=1 Tax=Gabonibacter massiliensis TaxID=1720195 RepID=UPI000AC92878|nr:bifunctional diaminohydroxyphosphoribosylaminopyrimidine deaminase/5-amino-6-(5-phosphoribosylamino)uracil reductase RibD [Gabonibacter massiliensis]
MPRIYDIRGFCMMGKEDLIYMRRAIELADRGCGFVNPNPLVGAVIVKNGKVIGEGWHERFGQWHAERNALHAAEEDTTGATLYVTLEPCCHYGKTPPCTEAIIEHKIAKVVVGIADPNPLVAGKGMALLREAGIEVVCGVEEERIREQNRIFLKYIETGMPWVVLKTASTLDGKIATYTGDSKWITGEESRAKVQEMRACLMAVVVGIGTVLTDDPMLNCRIVDREVRQPVRIIVDSNARVPLSSKIVRTATVYRTVVAHTRFAKEERLRQLRECGVETLLCDEEKGLVRIGDLCRKLGKSGIDSVLLEGGGSLNFSFLDEGLVDEVYAFIAPKMIGGMNAKTGVEGEGVPRMADAVDLKITDVQHVGQDVLLKLRINGKIR